MLELKNVTKYYGDFKAVDNLSFKVKDGEIFGLLGVNGAGKTTTFRMIINLLDKNEGTILLDGKPIDYSVTDKIGFLTEERSLLLKLTVLEQAIFYGTLKGLDKKTIEKRLDVLLERFKISEYKNRKIKELSKGNQQKVQFITAILHEPKLLILDEPFSGLDPINVEEFMKMINELKNKGTSIIFSSHRMEHVELFCDELVILVHGKSVLQGNLKDIKKKYRKKNIQLCCKGDVDKLKDIDGVLDIIKEAGTDTYIIKISDDTVVDKVFEVVKTFKSVTKFNVEEATLNEIFISKVGEAYEK
ncbi:aBC-type transport system ATPase component [Mycoplasma sp. CAG:956]|nr:aBC-type transport system ATPase component [Mycoplasma sp. CAG:956]